MAVVVGRLAALMALAACSAVATPSSMFLRASAPDSVSRARVVEQLQLLLSYDSNQERLSEVEGLLRPIFLAMPKNGVGGLDHRVTRHVLYRYFLVHHGWYVRGLALDVDEKSGSSSEALRKSQMPAFIMDFLEAQVRYQGTGLRELAVLAATIETLVKSDGIDTLLLAYNTHGISTQDLLDETELDLVIRTFTLYLLLPDARQLWEDPSRVAVLAKGGATRFYPGWEDTTLWVNDLRGGLDHEDRTSAQPFALSSHGPGLMSGFSRVARLATRIDASLGRFSDLECKAMKNTLMDLEDEDREDGRVRLKKFYGPYLASVSFHFSESPDYLRHLGALDERNPREMSAIVPNLMYAQANCLAASGFHSICCIDDCEILMSSLEQQVVGSAAAPASVAEAIARISSDTVAAPRNLSAPLLQRLDAIGARHGGLVPLHGRLFRELMHHAFPNECPYPRSLLTGESQLNLLEWGASQNRDPKATREEMLAVMAVEAEETPEALVGGPALEWSEEEELLGELPSPSSVGHLLATALRFAAGMGAVLASIAGIVNTARTGQTGGKGSFGLPYSASSVHCV